MTRVKNRFDVKREAYRPEKVRVLFIAESPPASGGLVYFPETIGKDPLFRETMKAVALWLVYWVCSVNAFRGLGPTGLCLAWSDTLLCIGGWDRVGFCIRPSSGRF